MSNGYSSTARRVGGFRLEVLAAGLAFAFGASALQAQSLGYEGPTGIFVTPLASTSPSPAKGFGKPTIAYHALAGGPVLGDFSMISVTEGFAKHFEIGYTRAIHQNGTDSSLSPLWTGGYNVIHGKATLLSSGEFGQKWLPSVAVGGILRTNVQNVGGEVNHSSTTNGDVYLVVTKVFPLTEKVPMLLNAGVRGTNASLWGFGGNAPQASAVAFGAVAFVFPGPFKSSITLGAEAAQQPQNVSGMPTLDIPTSLVYALRVTPSPKHKLNVDFGILQAAGRIAPGVNLQARARFGFGISYGF
jgi:hypothetical protein